MIYLELFLVAFVATFITELSGFMDSVKDWLGRWLGRPVRRLRPFDCSLCMTWWTCLAYAVGCGKLSVMTLAYVALLAMLARPMAELARAFVEVVLSLCRMWSDWIDID